MTTYYLYRRRAADGLWTEQYEVEDKWQARRLLNRLGSLGFDRAELYRPKGRKPVAVYVPHPTRRQWVRGDAR